MVAGVGFEPHDLQVMSLASYRTALPRDRNRRNYNTEKKACQVLFRWVSKIKKGFGLAIFIKALILKKCIES